MCVILSLLNTARNHDVNPRLYINEIIARMPSMEKTAPEELLELLPRKWIQKYPEALCKNTRTKAKEVVATMCTSVNAYNHYGDKFKILKIL